MSLWWVLVASLCVAGCTLISGPFQERGMSGYLEDSKVRLLLNERFLLTQSDLDQVQFLVDQGRVLLLGVVTPEVRARALAEVKGISGIRQVIDEMEVGQASTLDYAKDLLLSKRFETALFLDTEIFSTNYRIKAVNKVIYVLGTARNKRELDLLVKHGDTMPARRVVLHVFVAPRSSATP